MMLQIEMRGFVVLVTDWESVGDAVVSQTFPPDDPKL